MGPGARCLSLSSGPIESCRCDFKRETPCPMPQFPHPYRGQDVFTHMTGAFGLCRSSRGPPVALSPQQGDVASGDTEAAGHQPDQALSRRAPDRGSPCPVGVPRGSPLCAGPQVPEPGAHPRPGSHKLPKRVVSPHVSVCHLPSAPFAPRRQGACQPLCPQPLGPSPGPSTPWVFRQSHWWQWSQRAPSNPGGSTETAGAGRADAAWRGTCCPSLGQACVGGDPAQSPGTSSWSQHDSTFPYVEPVA